MNSHVSKMLQLPPDIRLEYIAEGGANIVYRIHSPSNPLSDPRVLLRLHKTVSWIPSYSKLYEAQQRLIVPLFEPSQLVSQNLVLIPSSLTSTCNAILRAAEEAALAAPSSHFYRTPNRHGQYLAEDEPHGLLLTDMTPDPSTADVMLEIKPKWLLQSPNAPLRSTRCRTCALGAMRMHKSHSDHSGGKTEKAMNQGATFCPLDLASGVHEGISRAVAAIVKRGGLPVYPSLADAETRSLVEEAVTFYLGKSSIISRLQELQASGDPRGILALPEDVLPGEDFLVATTLRDCTLFIRVSGNTKDIEARLGDLDLKVPEKEKAKQWRKTEMELIEGGWYFGRGQLDEELCRLGRSFEETGLS